MKNIGSFNNELTQFFDAECGAYTYITRPEIQKQTFNVKSVIKNLLIDKLGRSSIPKRTDVNSSIEFMLCEDLSSKYGESYSIPCKFSKPNKDEMSIYFSNALFIPKSSLHEGDFWCVYFKKNSNKPWFGFLNAHTMRYLQSSCVDNEFIEDDEYKTNKSAEIKSIQYRFDVNTLKITEIDPPMGNDRIKPHKAMKPGSKTVSPLNLKHILENKKIKGNRGEEIVLSIEKAKLVALNRNDLAKKVIWISKIKDGLGYDIESYDTDENGNNERKIFIEVKSTSRDQYEPFVVSKNEVAVSEDIGNDYYIYRVFDLKENEATVGYYKVCGSIENNFDLEPESFSAFAK